MKLRTSTWDGRDKNELISLRDAMREDGIASPLIIDVGIGGITYAIADCFPRGPKEEMSPLDASKRFLLRLIDDYLRKHGSYGKLKHYELDEVRKLFLEFNPSGIVVVDNDDRVLDTVNGTKRVSKLKWDITSGPLPVTGDIVICYNTVQITSNPQRSLEHLMASVNGGGFLSLNGINPSQNIHQGFSRMNGSLYRRQ